MHILHTEQKEKGDRTDIFLLSTHTTSIRNEYCAFSIFVSFTLHSSAHVTYRHYQYID